MVEITAMAATAAAFLVVGGWCVFSLCAGIVVYRASMTRNGTVSGLKKNIEINSHTNDPLVMNPINAAKTRWERARLTGVFQSLAVVTKRGLRLNAYYCEVDVKAFPEKCTRAVVLVHGLRDSSAGMAYLAEAYLAAGWNVLSVDLRAHGESEGTKITMGVREGQDLALWVELLVSRYGYETIFLHGVSMGAAAVLSFGALSSTSGFSPCVKGLILDSCFPAHRDTVIRLLSRIVGSRFVARSIAAGASIAAFVVSGTRFGQMDAKKDLRRCTLPVLAFHGGKDQLVPLSSITPVFRNEVIQSVELIVIPEAPHIGSYFYGRDIYLSKIEDFTRRFS
jgi:alpha-beta hydrolase superfamily lysophospholipase